MPTLKQLQLNMKRNRILASPEGEEMFAAGMDLSFDDSEGEFVWRTIGAEGPDSEGKKHGGSPMLIRQSDGAIGSGPMAGVTVRELKSGKQPTQSENKEMKEEAKVAEENPTPAQSEVAKESTEAEPPKPIDYHRLAKGDEITIRTTNGGATTGKLIGQGDRGPVLGRPNGSAFEIDNHRIKETLLVDPNTDLEEAKKDRDAAIVKADELREREIEVHKSSAGFEEKNKATDERRHADQEARAAVNHRTLMTQRAGGHVFENPPAGWKWDQVEPLAGLPQSEPAIESTIPEPEPADEPAKPEPATDQPIGDGGGRRPDVGATGGGGDRGTRGQGPRILTARPELTKPADPELVPEGLRKHLSEHQIEGSAKAIAAMDQHGGFLLADSTGVGKTRQLLAVGKTYADKGKKVLIVTKSEVIKPNWDKGEVSGSFLHDSGAMGVGISLNDGTKPLMAGQVSVTTYERIGDLKDQVDGDTVLLLDESHSLKNWQSARAKHGNEMAKKAHAVMYATATPADKPLHLAHLFRAKVFGNRKQSETFEEMGMVQKTINTPHGTVTKWEVNPRVGNAEVMRRISGLQDKMTEEGLMLRRELSFDGVDVGMHHIDLPPEAHEAMDKVASLIDAKGYPPGLRKAAILMHQRRQLEPYKVPATVDAIKKELAEGRDVVVFASRVNESEIGGDDEGDEGIGSEGTMKLLREALDGAGVKGVLELHGGITKAKRLKAMDDFQAGKGRVIIATIESGGTGINLDDTVGNRPRTMLMMTAPFSAVENVQAAGRIHRLKTKSDSRIRYIFGDVDVDHWNAKLISDKMKTLGATVSGNIRHLEGSPDVGDLVSEHKEPYQWPSLIGGSRGGANDITPRKAGQGYVHSIPMTPQLREMLNSPNKPRWMRINDYKGKQSVDVWGDNPAQVIERVGHAKSGNIPAAVARPEPPPAPIAPAPLDRTGKIAAVMTPEHKASIHAGLRHLAGMDSDRARERNDAGFNKMDSEFGGKLAEMGDLSDRQAAAGAHMLGKYKRQLPTQIHEHVGDLMKRAGQKEEEEAKQAAAAPAAPVDPNVRVRGNTFPHKEDLKRLGFRWDGERKVWYRARAGFDPSRLPHGLSHYKATIENFSGICVRERFTMADLQQRMRANRDCVEQFSGANGGQGNIFPGSGGGSRGRVTNEHFAADSLLDKHKTVAGMHVVIENPKGSTRSGIGQGGKPWRATMKNDYGFIANAKGTDGEGLDCYIGPDESAKDVHIVNQQNPRTGVFDEQKAMVGFHSPAEAKAAYLSHYDRPEYFRSMTIVPLERFKAMLHSGEPGSVRWKRKNRRELDTAAIFRAASEDFFCAETFAEEESDLIWRTIGAEGPDSEGKKHGGSRVQMQADSGKIVKGPEGLVGHTPNSIPSRHRQKQIGKITGMRQANPPARSATLPQIQENAGRQSPRSEQTGAPDKQIENAAMELGGGRPSQRLYLSDLRKKLTGMDRKSQDAALLDMAKSGRIVLHGMDDPLEFHRVTSDRKAADKRKAEEEETAFITPGGARRSIFYLQPKREEASQPQAQASAAHAPPVGAEGEPVNIFDEPSHPPITPDSIASEVGDMHAKSGKQPVPVSELRKRIAAKHPDAKREDVDTMLKGMRGKQVRLVGGSHDNAGITPEMNEGAVLGADDMTGGRERFTHIAPQPSREEQARALVSDPNFDRATGGVIKPPPPEPEAGPQQAQPAAGVQQLPMLGAPPVEAPNAPDQPGAAGGPEQKAVGREGNGGEATPMREGRGQAEMDKIGDEVGIPRNAEKPHHQEVASKLLDAHRKLIDNLTEAGHLHPQGQPAAPPETQPQEGTPAQAAPESAAEAPVTVQSATNGQAGEPIPPWTENRPETVQPQTAASLPGTSNANSPIPATATPESAAPEAQKPRPTSEQFNAKRQEYQRKGMTRMQAYDAAKDEIGLPPGSVSAQPVKPKPQAGSANVIPATIASSATAPATTRQSPTLATRDKIAARKEPANVQPTAPPVRPGASTEGKPPVQPETVAPAGNEAAPAPATNEPADLRGEPAAEPVRPVAAAPTNPSGERQAERVLPQPVPQSPPAQPAPAPSQGGVEQQLAASKNTKAPWQMTPGEWANSGAKTFKTSQGSIYAHSNGQTLRVKTPHLGHESADVGLKQGSEQTHFVHPEDARKVGMWNSMQGRSGKKMIRRGDELLMTSINPQTGHRGLDDRVKIASGEPSAGLAPLELFKKSQGEHGEEWGGNHPGNAITEIGGATPEAHRHFIDAARAAGKSIAPTAQAPPSQKAPHEMRKAEWLAQPGQAYHGDMTADEWNQRQAEQKAGNQRYEQHQSKLAQMQANAKRNQEAAKVPAAPEQQKNAERDRGRAAALAAEKAATHKALQRQGQPAVTSATRLNEIPKKPSGAPADSGMKYMPTSKVPEKPEGPSQPSATTSQGSAPAPQPAPPKAPPAKPGFFRRIGRSLGMNFSADSKLGQMREKMRQGRECQKAEA